LFGPPLKLSPIFAEVLSACQTGSRSSTGNGDLLRLADQEMFEVFLTPIKIETLAKSHRSPGRYRVFADDKLASDPKIHG
jgi:hypothetical protein